MAINIESGASSGPEGPEGPQGPQGVAGAVGPAGLVWQGTYNGSTHYFPDDAVSYVGSNSIVSSYFCIQETTGGHAPSEGTSNSFWALLAQEGPTGAQGPQGTAGSTGSTGSTGATGSAGPGVATGGSTGQILAKNSGTDYDTHWIDLSAPSFIYGDGSDGSATLDGITTPAWATRSGSVYTLIRDVFCTSLTVNNGVTVNANNAGTTGPYRIFCTGTLTNNGSIVTVPGVGLANGTAGTFPGTVNNMLAGLGSTGGAGQTTAGSISTATNPGLGGAGGNGGAGSGNAGGTAGTVTAPNAASSIWRAYPTSTLLTTLNANGTASRISGGTGGGGGGGDGTNKGGGGGGGGSTLMILAKTIAGTGAITSPGGNGGTPSTGNCGGGGAGGGGVVIIHSNSAVPGSQTVTAPAGTAGSGVGTGSAGSSGASGNVVTFIYT